MPVLLSGEQIRQLATNVPGWEVQDGTRLKRKFVFENFLAAIDFVNQLVEPSESLGHHPDISISYNKVVISLTTHDAGGLTEKDFTLAETFSKLT